MSPQRNPFISVRGLGRSFGSAVVLDDVSFDLDRGSVLALFGPNGAGKTTLLRTLAGALRPHAGTIDIEGRTQAELGGAWFRRVGVVSHASFLYGRLTVRENLIFYGKLFRLPNLRERVRQRLYAAGLLDRADQPARELSRGLTQRLSTVRALLHDPDLVLLDEPFAGLDTAAASVLSAELESLRSDQRAVLLITHDLTRGAALADRHAVLARGRLTTLEAGAAGPGSLEQAYHMALTTAQ